MGWHYLISKFHSESMAYFSAYRTILGTVYLTESSGYITRVSVGGVPPEGAVERETELIAETAEQIGEYLAGERTEFTVPYRQSGTEFQEAVWKALSRIGYGKTQTYKEIAESIGRPEAYRAVGNACGRNSLPIIVPCHRAVASDGIGGFSCGLDVKTKLMLIEGIL